MFELSGFVDIKALNVRKDGPDGDKVVAVDLKMECRQPAEVLDHFDAQLAKFLHKNDGSVRFVMMEPVGWAGEVKHCNLNMCDLKFVGVTVKKFTFQPVNNDKGGPEVVVGFQASFKPEGSEIAMVTQYLQESIEFQLFQESQLDFGGETASEHQTEFGTDALYMEAVMWVRETRRISISFIQRKFKIGYNRAARLIEAMEFAGVVSPMSGNGQREVL